MNKLFIGILTLAFVTVMMSSAEAGKKNRHQRQQQTKIAPEARTGDMSKDANQSMKAEDKGDGHEMNHEMNHEANHEKRDGDQGRKEKHKERHGDKEKHHEKHDSDEANREMHDATESHDSSEGSDAR